MVDIPRWLFWIGVIVGCMVVSVLAGLLVGAMIHVGEDDVDADK